MTSYKILLRDRVCSTLGSPAGIDIFIKNSDSNECKQLLDCQITVDQPLNNTCTAAMEVYKLGNAYGNSGVLSSTTKPEPLCHFMNEKAAFVDYMSQDGSLSTECPIEPGEVKIRVFASDPNRFLGAYLLGS